MSYLALDIVYSIELLYKGAEGDYSDRSSTCCDPDEDNDNNNDKGAD